MSENPPAERTPAETKRTDGPGHSKRVRARYAVLLLACTLAAYVFDQATKAWVVSTMTEGQITPVLPPLLNWHFIRNPGAAFSIGTNVTWIFTIVQALVSLAILTQIRKVASWGWAAALGLVLGGALGNLTDRLLREPSFGQGHVVDFIALPNFAIFNIADSAVVSGVILVCLMTLRGIGMDGRRSSDGAAGDSPAGKSAPGESTAGDRPAGESASGTGPDTPRTDGTPS
jgi:signal peptidase II